MHLNGRTEALRQCRAVAPTLVVLCILMASRAHAQQSDELSKRLAELRTQSLDCDDYSTELWHGLGVKPLLEVATEAANTDTPLETLEREYSLSEPAARHLLVGRLALCGTRQQAPAPTAVQDAMEQYSLAAREAPGSIVVLGAFLSLARGVADASLDARVLQALELAPDSATTALALARAGASLYRWRAILLAFAMQHKPELFPQVVASLDLNEDSSDEMPLCFEALQRSLAQQPPPPFLPTLAARTIRGLIAAELPRLALQTLRALPQGPRDAILTGAGGGQEGQATSTDETRLALAAEYLLEGQRAEAGRLFASVKAGDAQRANPKKGSRYRDECASRLRREALVFHLENKRSLDPFDAAVEVETCGVSAGVPWSLLLAGMLSPRYAETAQRRLTRSAEILEGNFEWPDYSAPAAALFPLALPRLLEAQKAEAARVHEALSSLQARGTPSLSAAEGDPLSGLISQLLDHPLPALFREVPLPQEIPAARVSSESKPDVKNLKLPEGFWPVRVERQRERVLLIAASQALDPTGEVSRGAYWLIESTDGGKTWGTPLYLGLRVYRPYVIVPSSGLPMLKGDLLRLEVQVRQLDEESITFPPIGRKVKRSANGLYLEARLSELRKDSDGDGLPDLVEARLLTDPKTPDTDGDGISDAEDPLPQIPVSDAGAGPEAEVLSEFFKTLDGGSEPQAHGVGLPEEDAPAFSLPRGAPLGTDPVTFIISERGFFRGVRSRSRTIVLTPQEYEKARRRFGDFYPLEVDALFLNETGDKVFLRYSEKWRGGSFLGEKKDGHWQLSVRDSWIT